MMAAVVASPFAAEPPPEPWWFSAMVTLVTWAANLLTRTTALLSRENARIYWERGKDQNTRQRALEDFSLVLLSSAPSQVNLEKAWQGQGRGGES